MEKKKRITKIIIAGGGINGIAIAGAVTTFLKYNKFKYLTDIVGISVGSIISLLLVLGYNNDEIKNIFIDLKMHEFMDYKFRCFIDNWGFDDGQMNKRLLQAILKNKNININITFKELYKITKKNLVIVGTNLSKETAEYFNHNTEPNMCIVDAVRISCCFPVVYSPVKYNNNLYVDGGVLAQYPLEYFDSKKNLLGFVIEDRDIKSKETVINSFDKYYLTLIKTIINKSEYNKVKKNIDITVIINKSKLHSNAMDYNLSTEVKNRLFNVGCDAYMDYYLSKNI